MPVYLWINPQEAVNKWYETEKDDITNVMFRDKIEFIESQLGVEYLCKVNYEMFKAPHLLISDDSTFNIKLEYRLPLSVRGKSSFNPVSINLLLHSVIHITLKNENNYQTKIYINLAQTVPFWQKKIAEHARIKAKKRINDMISKKLPIQYKHFISILDNLDNKFKQTKLFACNNDNNDKLRNHENIVIQHAIIDKNEQINNENNQNNQNNQKQNEIHDKSHQ